MKKIIAFIIAAIMAVSSIACGAKDNTQTPESDSTVSTETAQETAEKPAENTSEQEQEKPVEEAPSEEAAAEEPTTTEEDELEKDMEELSAIGDVEVENGILTVSITVPQSLVGEMTQEELDAGKGETYISATLNEDGSVTYKMTKAQYKEMLAAISESIEESIQELVDDDENYAIAAVEHNDDYTVFDVTMDGTELGLGDMFSAYLFFMCGGMYGVFTGERAESIIVNYYDADGNLIESADSANM